MNLERCSSPGNAFSFKFGKEREKSEGRPFTKRKTFLGGGGISILLKKSSLGKGGEGVVYTFRG